MLVRIQCIDLTSSERKRFRAKIDKLPRVGDPFSIAYIDDDEVVQGSLSGIVHHIVRINKPPKNMHGQRLEQAAIEMKQCVIS